MLGNSHDAVSVPEHLMHCFIVQSISIIHKDEAFLFIDHSLINPQLFGIHIWVVGIVCQKTQFFLGAPVNPNEISASIIFFPV